ncbi:hypothetical protein CWE15_05805 [Aliidiomarina taiwanensis]|uniref:Uncharacterized protein n=2 Tax=Aliidiomarina taiwanensis TaxID=946228 RepID=A0A432X7R0_9GAMM|nr:hypothetical protein CWE15_05805 [Aliidiomarina taiwanensis]
MDMNQAHSGHTSHCPMHGKTAEPMAMQHDCCDGQTMPASLFDLCESMDCEQSCTPCFATSVATLEGLSFAVPLALAGALSPYQFSLQVVAPSLHTPPPNAT